MRESSPSAQADVSIRAHGYQSPWLRILHCASLPVDVQDEQGNSAAMEAVRAQLIRRVEEIFDAICAEIAFRYEWFTRWLSPTRRAFAVNVVAAAASFVAVVL